MKGDRTAAQHYGYQVKTVKGDMSDLSAFADTSFDLVYQIHSIAWIPDVRPVYREVHRVLRPGGLYGVVHNNPAIHPATFSGGQAGWDGVGYRIVDRYKGGPILNNQAGVENMEEGEPTGDNRHLLKDIFGGLLELGFIIRKTEEGEEHLHASITAEPGSWTHMVQFLGLSINIIAEKAVS